MLVQVNGAVSKFWGRKVQMICQALEVDSLFNPCKKVPLAHKANLKCGEHWMCFQEF